MDTKYIAYYFTVSPRVPGTEILIAELGYKNFESFVETDEGVTAYIQENDWHPEILSDIYILNAGEFSIGFEIEEI